MKIKKLNCVISTLLIMIILAISYPLYKTPQAEMIYQNNSNETLRMDLFLAGNKNNSVNVSSSAEDFKINYPQWFNNPRWASWHRGAGIGSVITSKVNNKYEKLKFEITAQGEGQLFVFLRGPDVKINKKRIPVYLDYNNFKINGKTIFGSQKTQWHDDYYQYSINVKHGDEIILEFSVKNHEIPWIKAINLNRIPLLLLISILFSILVVKIIPTEILERIFFKSCLHLYTKLKTFINKNWINELTLAYNNIDPIYKNSFWILFGITNIVFAYHSLNFLFGNHDWRFIINGNYNFVALYDGRFAYNWLGKIVGGRILPLINNMFALLGVSLSVILLAIYWKVPKTKYNVITFSIFVATCPLILPWFYYAKDTIPNLWIPFEVILALVLSQYKNMLLSVIAVFLLVMALGTYAVAIDTIAVIFASKIFLDYFFEEKNFKVLFKKHLRALLNITIALACFYVIISYLKDIGKISNMYSTTTVPLIEIFSKSIEIIKAAFLQLVSTFPFIDPNYTKILLLLSIFALTAMIINFNKFKHSKFSAFISILMLIGILISSKLAALVSTEKWIMHAPRIDWYGLLYVYALAIVFLMKICKNWLSNILLVFMMWIIPMNICRAIDFQKVLKLGFDANERIMIRLTDRITKYPNFNLYRSYKLLSIGMSPQTRSPFYKEYYQYGTNDLLDHVFMPAWKPQEIFSYYMSSLTITDSVTISYNYNKLSKTQQIETVNEFKTYLLNTAKPWPHKDSVYVDDKYIVVVWDQKSLDYAKSLISTNKGEK